jgi:predicted GNAT family N-acyltransferase
MVVTVLDAYLAEVNDMKLLANLPRPNVPFEPEIFDGALCLWRTRGDGSHTDNIRLDPTTRPSVTDVLHRAKLSPLRVRSGNLLVGAVENTLSADDVALLDRLASSPKSTGYIMARSLAHVLDESRPRLRDGQDFHARSPETEAEYLEIRQLAADIFGGGASTYDPETDFYNAPDTMTYVAVHEQNKVIAAASILIVDGVANVWIVCTRESARGRGAASVVTHACLVEAYRQGATAAVLGTNHDLARPGGIYNRLGFETVGHEYGWMFNDFDRLALPAWRGYPDTHDEHTIPRLN